MIVGLHPEPASLGVAQPRDSAEASACSETGDLNTAEEGPERHSIVCRRQART